MATTAARAACSPTISGRKRRAYRPAREQCGLVRTMVHVLSRHWAVPGGSHTQDGKLRSTAAAVAGGDRRGTDVLVVRRNPPPN